ncbi:hypothetical protein NOR_03913 [Metarhizium rileyi]|uniref:Uncharacterized protein n=1 Tax=Metarhizium rileyi (strain RCEF 4871) TaxID=1649241 RepID=A0A167EN47_METRR|nr:hypothetical protein NOR_03913 [Metarhizium rileyi RCEF 4871]
MKFNTILASLSAVGYASACLHTYISIARGLEIIVYMSTYDNGVTTCEGHREGEGKGMNHADIHCKDGYSLHYDLQADGALATYGTPHGTYTYTVKDQKQCTYSNCCGGNIPCTCATCEYKSSNFGC